MRSAILFLVLSLCFGCTTRSAGSGPSGTTGPSAQPGQWEFVFTPSGSSDAYYVEANISANGINGFSSTTANSLGFSNAATSGTSSPFTVVGNIYIDASAPNGVLSGFVMSGGNSLAALSGGTIASNGMSISGSYSNTSGSGVATWFPTASSGNFTGHLVPTFNATFGGTASVSGQTAQVIISVNEDATKFTFTGSGTSTLPGVTTNLTISSGNVIGAVIEGSGTATNVNGTSAFTITGHSNAQETGMVFYCIGGAGDGTTGFCAPSETIR